MPASIRVAHGRRLARPLPDAPRDGRQAPRGRHRERHRQREAADQLVARIRPVVPWQELVQAHRSDRRFGHDGTPSFARLVYMIAAAPSGKGRAAPSGERATNREGRRMIRIHRVFLAAAASLLLRQPGHRAEIGRHPAHRRTATARPACRSTRKPPSSRKGR